MPEKTSTLVFLPRNEKRESETGDSILATAIKAGINLGQHCGGNGRCGKCRIRVVSGRCSEAGEREKSVLHETDLDSGTRLACQTFPL
ncbi:MAG: 2Fe-2S iron-sulfur cluster binding domain-containing protein, partial [Spirochaetales bacterium]